MMLEKKIPILKEIGYKVAINTEFIDGLLLVLLFFMVVGLGVYNEAENCV